MIPTIIPSKVIGIDVGIKELLTTSDGIQVKIYFDFCSIKKGH